MAKYIDREALRNAHIYLNEKDIAVIEIEDIPAADVQPVKHGRWISVGHKLSRICSVCDSDEPYKFADDDANVYNFCPNCGADMREES